MIPRSRLVAELKALGVDQGQTVMLHASMKAIGEVMGGPNVVLQALFETVGVTGAVMMYVGWEDMPGTFDDPADPRRTVFLEEYPVFDAATSRAVREHGILAEFLRTWPGARRSLNPEASMVACGMHAQPLVEGHPLDYGYGPGSPLAKLIEIKGKVLMLGAPLDAITLLHHAENLAKMRHKAVVHYRYPVLREGRRVWLEFEDYNTGQPHAAYSFREIAGHYMAANPVCRGKVGNAESYLFDAAGLTDFAVAWLESRFD